MTPFPYRFGSAVTRLAPMVAALAGLWMSCGAARATTSLLQNPDFDTDLSQWQTAGDVQHSTEFAVILDDVVAISSLHQSAAAGPGLLELEFDFIGALSSVVPMGTFLDVAFASLYLGDGPFVSPGDAGSFDEVIALFDLDASGTPSNVAPGATILPSPDQAGWSRFNLTFATPRLNVTPFFEVLDQNTIDADSSFGIDRVRLTVVPEPGHTVLLSIGAAILVLGRKRRF